MIKWLSIVLLAALFRRRKQILQTQPDSPAARQIMATITAMSKNCKPHAVAP